MRPQNERIEIMMLRKVKKVFRVMLAKATKRKNVTIRQRVSTSLYLYVRE